MKGFREEKELLKALVTWAVVLFAILEAVFYRESIAVVARFVVGVLWLFVIPGTLTAMLIDKNNKLGITEKSIAGTAVAIIVTGITSYYLGLAGLNVRSHWIIIPLLIIGAYAIVKLFGRRR